MAYSDIVLADSPVGYWQLQETSGTNAADSSGNGNNGTYTNGVTLNQSATGSLGVSASFDGTDDYVLIPDSNVFSANNNNTFTIELWISITTETNEEIFSKGGTTASSYEWRIRYDSDNHRFIPAMENSAGTEIGLRYGNGSKTTATWYHMVAVVNGTPNSTKPDLYVNGVAETSAGTGGAGGTYTNGSSGLWIGGHAAYPHYFNGKICHVAIYNAALSSTQVTTHYNAGIGNATITAPTPPSITFTPQNPTVSAFTDINIAAPTPSSITFTPQDPTLVVDVNIAAPAASNITFTPQDPTVATVINAQIDPTLMTSTWTAQDPTIVINNDVNISAPTPSSVTFAANTITTYPFKVLADHPTVYWQFEEGDARDSSGNGNDGVLDGAASTSVTGWETGFKGIQIADAGGYTSFVGTLTDDWTIDFWWKQTNTLITWDLWNLNAAASDISIQYNEGGGANKYRLIAPGGASFYTSTVSTTSNTWHHVAVSCSKSSTTRTLTFYADGLVVGTSTNTVTTTSGIIQTRGIRGDFTTGLNIDEIAIYPAALGDTRIADHAGILVDITVAAPVAGPVVFTAQIPTVTTGTGLTNIDAPVLGNVTYTANTPDLIINGGPVIIPDLMTETWTALAPTISLTGNPSITVDNVPAAVFEAKDPDVTIRVDDLTFSFIDPSDTSFAALDAVVLTSLDFGVLFHNDSKSLGFRIGNTSNYDVVYDLSATGLNPILVSGITFSADKVDWTTTLQVGKLTPNTISDTIWVKFTADPTAYNATGTVVINVEQTNV